jgi:hypothetical protein
MYSGVNEYVIYQIANSPMREYPYPHIYVDSVFPPDFYRELRRNWPTAENLVTLESTGRVPRGAYPQRFIMPLRDDEVEKLPPDRRQFWKEFSEWLLGSHRFMEALIEKFEPFVKQRFGAELPEVGFLAEALVVRDHTNYKIGPHTDATTRLMSLLFYCPDDDSLRHLGTSIYTPIDPDFRCQGGPHYPHKMFRKVVTMEYRPNTLFAFFKTDHSFHGVDPIKDADVLRDLLLYDIRVDEEHATAPPEPQEKRAGPRVGLGMLRNIFK